MKKTLPEEGQPWIVHPRDLLPDNPDKSLVAIAELLLETGQADSREQALCFASIATDAKLTGLAAVASIVACRIGGARLNDVDLRSEKFEADYRRLSNAWLFLQQPGGSA